MQLAGLRTQDEPTILPALHGVRVLVQQTLVGMPRLHVHRLPLSPLGSLVLVEQQESCERYVIWAGAIQCSADIRREVRSSWKKRKKRLRFRHYVCIQIAITYSVILLVVVLQFLKQPNIFTEDFFMYIHTWMTRKMTWVTCKWIIIYICKIWFKKMA